MIRPKATTKAESIEVLADGTELVELKLSRRSRKADPELPKTIRARMIRVEVKGYRPWMLLTSLLDVERYPAAEIARRYHERWECELAYKEVKTELLERKTSRRAG